MPLRGPNGFYLALVHSREDEHEVGLTDPPTAKMVRQDYLHRRFCAWANEVLMRAVIR